MSTNIEIQKEKEAVYRKLVRPKMMDELKEKIFERLVVKKKYRDPSYSATRLASDLETNIRYVSAVIRVMFHTNYTTFVNKYRIEEAIALLTDERYADLNVEDIGYMVGFPHRQSFHAAFVKFTGLTPKSYRMQGEQQPEHPSGFHKKSSKK